MSKCVTDINLNIVQFTTNISEIQYFLKEDFSACHVYHIKKYLRLCYACGLFLYRNNWFEDTYLNRISVRYGNKTDLRIVMHYEAIGIFGDCVTSSFWMEKHKIPQDVIGLCIYDGDIEEGDYITPGTIKDPKTNTRWLLGFNGLPLIPKEEWPLLIGLPILGEFVKTWMREGAINNI